MLRTEERRVLAPSVAQRRALATAVHAFAERAGLLAFRGSDTHIHLVLLADRALAGRTARALSYALHARLGLEAPFEPARIKPVDSQSHLENVFDYVLRQDARHGFDSDPWHDASVLPDLLGLRAMGGDVRRRMREYLPRVGRDRLLARLGVETLHPGTDTSIGVEAAAAAVARPDLSGKARDVCAARRALLALFDEAGAPHPFERSVACRLRRIPAEPRLLRAISLQIGFREDVRATRLDTG